VQLLRNLGLEVAQGRTVLLDYFLGLGEGKEVALDKLSSLTTLIEVGVIKSPRNEVNVRKKEAKSVHRNQNPYDTSSNKNTYSRHYIFYRYVYI
jgi:hypothetical protein